LASQSGLWRTVRFFRRSEWLPIRACRPSSMQPRA
jgi:hypothetical protein